MPRHGLLVNRQHPSGSRQVVEPGSLLILVIAMLDETPDGRRAHAPLRLYVANETFGGPSHDASFCCVGGQATRLRDQKEAAGVPERAVLPSS